MGGAGAGAGRCAAGRAGLAAEAPAPVVGSGGGGAREARGAVGLVGPWNGQGVEWGRLIKARSQPAGTMINWSRRRSSALAALEPATGGGVLISAFAGGWRQALPAHLGGRVRTCRVRRRRRRPTFGRSRSPGPKFALEFQLWARSLNLSESVEAGGCARKISQPDMRAPVARAAARCVLPKWKRRRRRRRRRETR